MTQYAILTDLNRCVGCMACMVSCKVINGVPIGSYWNKMLRIGPYKRKDYKTSNDVDMYYLNVQCQHCENPKCVEVCPTGASHKTENGTIQVDKDKCIGCQFCVMACPYGVRYLNKEQGVVEKCTRCYQKTQEGELPACVVSCGGRARWFGDMDKGWDDFRGSLDANGEPLRLTDEDYIKPFTDADVHSLPDSGNHPSDRFILRNRVWR